MVLFKEYQKYTQEWYDWDINAEVSVQHITPPEKLWMSKSRVYIKETDNFINKSLDKG